MNLLRKSAWVEGNQVIEGNLFNKRRVDIFDVQEVHLITIPKITYDERFISLVPTAGEPVSVGELDQCFPTLIKLLEKHLFNFHLPSEYGSDSDAGSERVVWRRPVP